MMGAVGWTGGACIMWRARMAARLRASSLVSEAQTGLSLQALMPCGHRCCCAPCAGLLLAAEASASRCPVCRSAITGSMRVFDV